MCAGVQRATAQAAKRAPSATDFRLVWPTQPRNSAVTADDRCRTTLSVHDGVRGALLRRSHGRLFLAAPSVQLQCWSRRYGTNDSFILHPDRPDDALPAPQTNC